jgi:hypothetical protein
MLDTGSAWLRGVRIRGFRFLAEQRVRTLKVLKLEIFDLRFFTLSQRLRELRTGKNYFIKGFGRKFAIFSAKIL